MSDVESDAESGSESDNESVKPTNSSKHVDDSDNEDAETVASDADNVESDSENDSDSDVENIDSDDEEYLKSKSKYTASRTIAMNDDDDDFDENDEVYFQKLSKQMKTNIISDYHPELKVKNYDEIEALTRIVRDETGKIIDPLHKTVPFITKYEKAHILGERATQINSDADIFVAVDPSIIDGYLIACEEYKQKKIPFIVCRPLPNGGIEYWKFKDLEQLF